MSSQATIPRIEFFVPGLPVAQPRQRTRVVAAGGRTFASNYTPSNHPVNAFKAAVRMAWPTGQHPIGGAVSVELFFVFPLAASKRKKVNAATRKTNKPDVDNLAKGVCDALNGLAWNDDCQVAKLTVEKWTAGDGDTAGVHVTIDAAR